MCTIEGPVNFMIGQKDDWSQGLEDGLVEELEAQLRQKLHDEFSDAPIVWSLNRDSLQELPDDLAQAENLPASAHTHFISSALAEFNDARPADEHIWFSAAEPDDGETCCYYIKHAWSPCAMVKLNRGPGKDRLKERWTIELEHPDLDQPVQVQMIAKVEWSFPLGGQDADAATREEIKVLLPQAQGDKLQQALAILQGASV
jgi:hypothetical protein